MHVDGGVSAGALVQRAEEHASAHAEPVHSRVKPSVLYIQHDGGLTATQRPRADAVDARAMSEHVLQQPWLLHSVQGAQADGLQANALAHRPRRGGSLEERHAHAALREVQRCGAAGEARAHDANAQRLDSHASLALHDAAHSEWPTLSEWPTHANTRAKTTRERGVVKRNNSNGLGTKAKD